ncbi:pirin family protein [Thioalkalicoccus limnaeus]|uniref:Pirin family protein n=1 Tax=Thioalkalicoccus limnaeus TaxID=120681 RepID=A0ABV4BAN7_9GAMM
MTNTAIERILTATPAADGAGVKLYRILGPDGLRGLDPFLLLDDFGSDAPTESLAGFPSHPHRGFETVTYMLAGAMRHEDHLGHRGLVTAGGVQWMTAGRGVIHSEMPEPEDGRLRGLQLWINLPARDKMKAPAYRQLAADAIPTATWPDGTQAKVIAGVLDTGARAVRGPVQGLATEPLYADARLPAAARLRVPVPAGHRPLVYVIEGRPTIAGQALAPRQMAVLVPGTPIELEADADGARVLLLAARPLGEPIAHYGPFVMNSRDEIRQAIADYEAGRLAA